VPKLTRELVINIIGHTDDWKIAQIIATGATSDDLVEAFTRMSKQGDLAAEILRGASPTVRQLFDILTADEPAWMEREP